MDDSEGTSLEIVFLSGGGGECTKIVWSMLRIALIIGLLTGEGSLVGLRYSQSQYPTLFKFL